MRRSSLRVKMACAASCEFACKRIATTGPIAIVTTRHVRGSQSATNTFDAVRIARSSRSRHPIPLADEHSLGNLRCSRSRSSSRMCGRNRSIVAGTGWEPTCRETGASRGNDRSVRRRHHEDAMGGIPGCGDCGLVFGIECSSGPLRLYDVSGVGRHRCRSPSGLLGMQRRL